MNIQKLILIILDGWGIGDGTKSDVIASTPTPNISGLLQKYPHSQLLTCGENVGLPHGQMGNSEVGHLNIGSGRVIYQDLVKINRAVEDRSIDKNPVLLNALKYAQENDKKLHLLGLVSDGGVHSSDKHLYHICDMAKDMGLKKVFIHALTDGRDTDPKSGLGFITNLEKHLENSTGTIASVCGRYYTMDRDKRWERVKVGYDLLVNGVGVHANSVVDAIKDSYEHGVTDEFIKPIIKIDDSGDAVGIVENGDVFLCFNFRTDRLREITHALTQKEMPEFGMETLKLNYLTLTRYDDTFKNVNVVFDKENIKKTLGEIIQNNKLKQLRIAETEKYAHVTFFFSGGRENPFEGESRILMPSPKVATYDLQPEMSAFLVKDAVVNELNLRTNDFICLNFANGDMVGHTGIYEAIQKAVLTVDQCVGEISQAAFRNGYVPVIIADHGNADYAQNPDGSPNTAHSLNPVPCIVGADFVKRVENGILADVAPTILKLMNLPIPEEMTGKSLI